MNLYSVLTHLPQVVRAALAALHDPAGNPKEALLAIAAAVVVLLIGLVLVILVVLLVNDLRRPRAERSTETAARARGRRPALAAAVWLVLGLLALVAIGVGWNFSVRTTTCGRCHFTAQAVASHAADTRHAAVACSACHVAPGIGGALQAAGTGLGNLAVQVSGKAPDSLVGARVSDSACLSCHAEVSRGVVVDRGIRMRHSDVLAIGYACTDCHNTIGHGTKVVRPRYPQMSQCLTCHDGTKAKTGCATCHSTDVGRASRIPTDSYVKVNVQVTDCRGCHSMTTCIDCHGIELPHSQQFKDGYHALKALQEPQVCIKCHKVQTDCNRCHHFDTTASGLPKAPHTAGAGFVAWHKTTLAGTASRTPTGQPVPDSCSCHTAYTGIPEQQFCVYCHGKQPSH